MFLRYLAVCLLATPLGTRLVSESQTINLAIQPDPLSILSSQERRIITERSKYIYRLDNGVVVDGYYLFHFQNELRKNITEERVTRSRGNFSTPQEIRSTKKYRPDEELQSYFSIPLFPAVFWFNGKMLNDRATWVSPELDAFRAMIGVVDTKDKKFHEKFSEAAARQIPVLVAIDPLSKEISGREIYGTSRSSHGLQTFFEYATTATFTNPMQSLASAFHSENARGNPKQWIGFHILPGINVSDGKPSSSLSQFMLLAGSSQPSTTPVLAPTSGTVKPPIFYEVVTLQRMKLNVREVAELYLDGKIQIPYRENVRKSGAWTCEEHLLTRP